MDRASWYAAPNQFRVRYDVRRQSRSGLAIVSGYKIFNRYKECGVDTLFNRSRRPYRQAKSTSAPPSPDNSSASARSMIKSGWSVSWTMI
ncbi:leucine zipper domain-containing protein [Fodinicurvata halophila]|uniref:Leucine zipper domain-containing protein n=1 Tax=Fodinicurvata halophila TaxID=1419723 RepID=A0ABV8UH32_9PROT